VLNVCDVAEQLIAVTLSPTRSNKQKKKRKFFFLFFSFVAVEQTFTARWRRATEYKIQIIRDF
jgi:hypothetical protein